MNETGKFTVGVARCSGYDRKEMDIALKAAIANAGGLPQAALQHILIKPNLLSPSYPDEAVTTHPSVVHSLIKEVFDAGLGEKAVSIRVSDSPGYVFTNGETLLGRTGMKSVENSCDVRVGLLSDKGFQAVNPPEQSALKELRISSRYMESDYCINVAKFKTHVETEISCCIKNIFGTADSDTRKRAHRSRSQKHLAGAIVDIFCVKPPVFNIIDAVVGMEGYGPSHGTPRRVGWLIASENALAADWAAAIMMGYANPADIPLISAAVSRGLGPESTDDIKIAGATWEELAVKKFRKSPQTLRLVPTPLRGMVHGMVKMKPSLSSSVCTRCGICKEVCPVSAISLTGGYPEIDEKNCVRCMCCHEMCPTGAMKVRKNLIARIVGYLKDA